MRTQRPSVPALRSRRHSRGRAPAGRRAWKPRAAEAGPVKNRALPPTSSRGKSRPRTGLRRPADGSRGCRRTRRRPSSSNAQRRSCRSPARPPRRKGNVERTRGLAGGEVAPVWKAGPARPACRDRVVARRATRAAAAVILPNDADGFQSGWNFVRSRWLPASDSSPATGCSKPDDFVCGALPSARSRRRVEVGLGLAARWGALPRSSTAFWQRGAPGFFFPIGGARAPVADEGGARGPRPGLSAGFRGGVPRAAFFFSRLF